MPPSKILAIPGKLSEITEEFQYTEDVDLNGRLDFELPLATGANQNLIKFSARVRTKAKERDNDFYEYSPANDDVFNSSLRNLEDQTKDNFLPGDYTIGSFATKEFVGDLNLKSDAFEEEQDLSELAGNFTASEQIFGGYAMLEQNIGKKFLLVAGVRVEQTNLEYEGNAYDDEEETLNATDKVESDYLNILPGIHMKYNLQPRTLLRFAWTNTLARPNYFDLVPFREIADGEELTIGNPDLEATTSMNFDLMAEHYFGTVGILSGGVFFKDISDFIVTERQEDFNFEGQVWPDFARPINGGNATLYGAEVAFQRQLDFISPALKGVGIYFNYTFTTSEVTDFNFEGREDEELELPGAPQHTLNASIAYEGKRFTSRISLNYASDFVDEVGAGTFFDRYYDEVTYLDFNASFSITENLVVYANANNLLNQPLRYFQGVSDRTMQSEFYNVRFDLGLKFDLTK
jgi:TonB-dependent receptor